MIIFLILGLVGFFGILYYIDKSIHKEYRSKSLSFDEVFIEALVIDIETNPDDYTFICGNKFMDFLSKKNNRNFLLHSSLSFSKPINLEPSPKQKQRLKVMMEQIKSKERNKIINNYLKHNGDIG